MKKCKHCGKSIESMPHHCDATGKSYYYENDSFLETLIVGAVINELLSDSSSLDSSSSDSSSNDTSSSDTSSVDFGGGDFGGGGGGGDW